LNILTVSTDSTALRTSLSPAADRGADHRRRAIGEDRGALAARLQFAQHVERVGKCVELEIGVEQLAAKGYVRSPTDLVLSVIGIAVGDSAPTPVMKTTEDFVAFMKATPSIAYTTSGVSGLHMAKLIEQLGLTAVVKPKAMVVEGLSGTQLREGKVAAAVQQISELKLAGAKNIVPLPDAIQARTIFAVAVLSGTARADAAAKVVRVLTSTEAAAAYEHSGVSPLFK